MSARTGEAIGLPPIAPVAAPLTLRMHWLGLDEIDAGFPVARPSAPVRPIHPAVTLPPTA